MWVEIIAADIYFNSLVKYERAIEYHEVEFIRLVLANYINSSYDTITTRIIRAHVKIQEFYLGCYPYKKFIFDSHDIDGIEININNEFRVLNYEWFTKE